MLYRMLLWVCGVCAHSELDGLGIKMSGADSRRRNQCTEKIGIKHLENCRNFLRGQRLLTDGKARTLTRCVSCLRRLLSFLLHNSQTAQGAYTFGTCVILAHTLTV